MGDDELKSFKISDTQRPTVGRATGGAGAEGGDAGIETQSLGFARIEKLLEDEDAASLEDKLTGIMGSLDEFEGQASSNKDKLAVKKGRIAVEKVADLMSFLFQTKADLESPEEG
ncbi:MAG: hypothetical protein CMH60_04525 [Myxococcales bacterium]|nr:hypothetical protein [Myxococcales bacterium]|tara:strand:+ start:424 stop:768 length:345 start_codon:yes stop_codon:yes gene_type:complete